MANSKNDKTQSKKTNTNGEPEYIRTSDEAIEKIISGFAEISREAQKDADEERKKPRFIVNTVDIALKNQVPELMRMERLIDEEGFYVEVLDNIEYKNASAGSKYQIRISNANGIFVTFDLLEYKAMIKEWDFDEVAFIADKLSRITGDTSDRIHKIARIVAEYLSILIYYPDIYVKTYTNLGWDYLDGQVFFKYDSIYSISDWRSEFNDPLISSLIPQDESSGDEFKWFGLTVELMKYSKYTSLILAAGISGVIRQLLPFTKETNINMNIVGERASGKSTIGHYVLSIFGNPAKLEGSFVDTTNKVDEIRAKRSVLPYVLDERMLRIEDTNELARKRAIIMDIFREYEGKVKERVGKQFDKISGERTCGPIISSSVRSIMDEIYDYADLGQFRRFIELKITAKDLFPSKAKAEEAEEVAATCYGYGIKMILNRLFEYIDVENAADSIVERFKVLNEEISKSLTKLGMVDILSSSSRFALIVLSYQILRESLIDYGNEKTDGVTEIENLLPDKTKEILQVLAENVIDKMNRVNNSKMRKSELLEYVRNYEGAFFEVKGKKDEGWDAKDSKTAQYIGKIKKGNNSVEVMVKQSYKLEQILFRFNGEIPDPSQIRKYIDLCENDTKAPDTVTMFNKLKGISEAQIDEFLNYNEGIGLDGRLNQRNRLFGKGTPERALIIRLDY